MATINITSRQAGNRRGKATAIALLNEQGRHPSRVRNAMILAAIVMLGTAAATHAFAAERSGDNLGLSDGYRGGHMTGGFQPPVMNQVPPAPIFNPSEPYTVPQSPETPVSPASPGSIFGNG